MSHLSDDNEIIRAEPVTASAAPADAPDTPAGVSSEQSDAGLDSPSWDRSTDTYSPIPPLPTSVPSLDAPTQVGPYPIKGKIGAGGIGVVLRGYDAEFNRSLAVKLLQFKHKNNPDLAARFLDEAQLMGQLQHPNIPPVHRLGNTTDGRPYFSMKWIKGKTLSALLRKRAGTRDCDRAPCDEQDGRGALTQPRSPEDLPRFVGIFENICKAMAYTHSRLVIHRDLKPENIMVGSLDEMYVMDWGMARKLETAEGQAQPAAEDQSAIVTARSLSQEQLTRAGMGTIGFMPPEQILAGVGQVDARSDVFGLGAILCVILTGKPPYQASTKKELFTVATGGKLCASGLERLEKCGADAELVALAKACLAQRREDRPANAGEVADTVTHYQAKVQEERRQLELKLAKEEIKRLERRKQRRLVSALALLGFLTLSMICAYQWWMAELTNESINELVGEKLNIFAKENLRRINAPDLLNKHLAYFQAKLKALEDLVPKTGSSVHEQSLELAKQDVGELVLAREINNIHARQAVVSLKKRHQLGNLFAKEGEAERAYSKLQALARYEKESDSPENLQRLHESLVSTHLFSALDDWALLTADADLQERLHRLLGKAHPEFAKIRKQLRDWKPGDDLDQIKKLVDNKNIAALLINEYKRQVLGETDPLPALTNILRLQGEFAAFVWLGNANLKARRLDEAGLYFLQASRHPLRDTALALNNLGCVLFYQGDFANAKETLEAARKSLSDGHSLHEEIKDNLELCNEYILLDQNLKSLLKKSAENQLKNPEKELMLADLCFHRKMYLESAKVAKAVFKHQETLFKPALSHHRYQAARAIVLAAKDLSKEERPIWLDWARQLLNVDLQAWKSLLEGPPVPRASQALAVQQWRKDEDLAGVRVKGTMKGLLLDGLPKMDLQAWTEFWIEVENLVELANKLNQAKKSK